MLGVCVCAGKRMHGNKFVFFADLCRFSFSFLRLVGLFLRFQYFPFVCIHLQKFKSKRNSGSGKDCNGRRIYFSNFLRFSLWIFWLSSLSCFLSPAYLFSFVILSRFPYCTLTVGTNPQHSTVRSHARAHTQL